MPEGCRHPLRADLQRNRPVIRPEVGSRHGVHPRHNRIIEHNRQNRPARNPRCRARICARILAICWRVVVCGTVRVNMVYSFAPKPGLARRISAAWVDHSLTMLGVQLPFVA